MPIYEYQCSSCGDEFEKMQKMDAPKTAPCPKCEGEAQRMISLSSFALKGGGWYSDGYTTKASAKPEPAACASSGGCPAAGQCAAASS